MPDKIGTRPVSVAHAWPSIQLRRAMAEREAHDRAIMDVAMFGERSTLGGLFCPSKPEPVARWVTSTTTGRLTTVVSWLDGSPVRDAETYPGGAAMKADGWEMMLVIWDPVTPLSPQPHRSKVVHATWQREADGGRIDHARVRRGRWRHRVPTNRKRKRERCKARRRVRGSR